MNVTELAASSLWNIFDPMQVLVTNDYRYIETSQDYMALRKNRRELAFDHLTFPY